MATNLKALLQEALSWSSEEEVTKSMELATQVVNLAQVDKWKEKGVDIKRACVARNFQALLHVHISGPEGFCFIEAAYGHESDSLTVRSRGQLLNGAAPQTNYELIKLVDTEAERLANKNKCPE